MQLTHNEEMYKNMVLTIPDLVLPQHIPYIIHWFDYYGIADVKKVDVRVHPEPEYYVEDKPYYGYAVIEIREWYKNNRSLSFYENLITGYANMVYDDPYYPNNYEIEFYEPRTQEEVNNIVLVQPETQADLESDPESEHQQDKFDLVKDDEDKEYLKAETLEAKQQIESYEEDDENYEFVESNEDYKYEYLLQKGHKMNTRYKTKCKEDKGEATNLNTENITLTEIIVKKNKNYRKRNKRKVYKNEWNRRLRVKLSV